MFRYTRGERLRPQASTHIVHLVSLTVDLGSPVVDKGA